MPNEVEIDLFEEEFEQVNVNTQTYPFIVDDSLIKSKERVQSLGEVFTPSWMVDEMLDTPEIKAKTADVFSTFLEPSAGEGAFLVGIIKRKLQAVQDNYSLRSWKTYGLWALSSVYAIEYMADNVEVARRNVLGAFVGWFEQAFGQKLSAQTKYYKSAKTIIWSNIQQGNTLTRLNDQEDEIVFSAWQRVKGHRASVKRELFTYSSVFADYDEQIALLVHDADIADNQIDLFGDEVVPDVRPVEYEIVEIDDVYKGATITNE